MSGPPAAARFRPTVAVVDLEATRHNVRTMKPPGAQLMAVVKADAYGHGDVPVARAALEAGATWLGVALVEEGIALRDAGIDAPILVLSELPRGSEKDALAAGLTPTVYTGAGATLVGEAARASGGPGRVHLKIDTGMHRVGADPDEAVDLAAAVASQGLDLEAVWTHLARADEPDQPSAREQMDRFAGTLSDLAAAGFRPRIRHAANSAAAIAMPEAHLDLVRVGIAMYGIAPGPELGGRVDLRPAMSLRSQVSAVRRVGAGEGVSYGHRYRPDRSSTIATAPVGYADGYARALSNRGHVLIRGRRYPVAGTVTMDQLMVDCGDDPVEPGDEVVLFGKQDGAEIRAEEVADWAGTIGYEVVTAVSHRVPREHRG
ncbi:MAG: alanine racemase [Actinomycetota bacterium]